MSINELKIEIERIEKLREEKINRHIIPLESKLEKLRNELDELQQYFFNERVMEAIDKSLS